MRIAILCSTKDPASVLIKAGLQQEGFKDTFEKFGRFPVLARDGVRVYTAEHELVTWETPEEKIQADLFIFASRHSGRAGIPSLTVHALGNWGEAELGGRAKSLAVAPALYLRAGLHLLTQYNTLGFDVFQEVTHHGPFSTKPCLFMEVGSSEAEWRRADAAAVVAKAISRLVSQPPPDATPAIGFGGIHNAPAFVRIMLKANFAFGHIAAKHHLGALTEDLVYQAINRTSPRPVFAVLDWKGLGEHKATVLEVLKKFEIYVVRNDKL